jgi:hypothetical protein
MTGEENETKGKETDAEKTRTQEEQDTFNEVCFRVVQVQRSIAHSPHQSFSDLFVEFLLKDKRILLLLRPRLFRIRLLALG